MQADKNIILEQIKASRAGMRIVSACITTFPELSDICHTIIQIEQKNIQQYFQQLIELERNK